MNIKDCFAYLIVIPFLLATADAQAQQNQPSAVETLLERAGLTSKSARPISDYQSPDFGYRFSADAQWSSWSDLDEDAPVADIGALTNGSSGVNVVPVCWQGAAPPKSAIYSVMMRQASEDYPSAFVERDEDIVKDGATGKLLVGTTPFDGEDFDYYHWIVATDTCAYMLTAWGPASDRKLEERLTKLWDDFSVGLAQTASENTFSDKDAARVNALLSNAFGLYYYEVRSYRDAFRFFAAANAADPIDVDYVTNAVRSLSSVNAYSQAATWLDERAGPFATNQVVTSWQAWLAYKMGNTEKAVSLYAPLFANDYRDDEDFSVYVGMLADRSEWEKIDALYDAYTATGETAKHRTIRAQLLARRGEYEQALDMLNEMVDPNALDADLAFERLSIMDDMDAAVEMSALSQQLIDGGYRSLQSYFYQGRAQYLLRDFKKAKAAFLVAQEFAPGNETVQEYIAAIDRTLGQGDVSMISASLTPVELPRSLAKIAKRKKLPPVPDEAAADYPYAILGFSFDGSELLRRTVYRKIRIIDERGVADFSTIEMNFDPAYEQLFVNRLIVRDADGAVIGEGDLNSYYITTVTDGYEASTERTAHLPVPGLIPGATIELMATKHINTGAGDFPIETVYLSRSRPVGTSALFVTGKFDDIDFDSFEVPEPKRISDSLIWRIDNPRSYRWEPLQPYYDKMISWVQLGSPASDWTSVGNEYLKEIDDKLDSDSVAQRAQRLVEGIDDPQRKIDVLSAYVQEEIQYKALEFGRRAYIPKTARETLRDRYGDCKDHSVLLHDMLGAVGIDSSLALVNLQQQVLPELPNRDQFDHMIVTATVDGVGRFIDTTDKDLRLGQLAPRYMGKNYALVLADTSQLVQMPDYDDQDATINVERGVEVQPDGVVSISERITLAGYHAAQLRGQLRSVETAEMRDALQRWLNLYVPDAELDDYFVENIFDPAFDLVVEMQFTLRDDVGGAVSVPGFAEAAYLEYDRVSDRQFGFELVYPLKLTSVSELSLGDQYTLSGDINTDMSSTSRFGNWDRRIEQGIDSAVMTFGFTSPAAQFEPEAYRTFTDFQKKASRSVRTPLSKTF
ncbi:MAG: DUF3857 domain-containing protein [Pseudomonadota bacterium]